MTGTGISLIIQAVLIPWIAVGLGALAACSGMRERCMLRKTEAAQARL